MTVLPAPVANETPNRLCPASRKETTAWMHSSWYSRRTNLACAVGGDGGEEGDGRGEGFFALRAGTTEAHLHAAGTGVKVTRLNSFSAW